MEMSAYQESLEKYLAAEARLKSVETERELLLAEREGALEVLRRQIINVDDLIECARAQSLNLRLAHSGKKTRITLTRTVRPSVKGFEKHVVFEKAGGWEYVKAATLEALVKLDADRLPEQLGASEELEGLLKRVGELYWFDYETQGGKEHKLEVENYSPTAQAGYGFTRVLEWGWGKDLRALIEA